MPQEDPDLDKYVALMMMQCQQDHKDHQKDCNEDFDCWCNQQQQQ